MTRILLVEDDRWLGDLEVRALESEGHNVTLASNALEAIDCIDTVKPEVIILDVLLTGSTAFALLHELQSYSDTNIVPVILSTNLAEQLKVADLQHYGVQRILDKTTMQPEDLAVAVRAVTL